MKGTLALSWGPYGGFYVHPRRVCLGWVALTLLPRNEIDELMEGFASYWDAVASTQQLGGESSAGTQGQSSGLTTPSGGSTTRAACEAERPPAPSVALASSDQGGGDADAIKRSREDPRRDFGARKRRHVAEGRLDDGSPLAELLWEGLEYAQHDSWRCEHPDRYPPEPDCCCGLLSFTARVEAAIGKAPEHWRPPPIDTWPSTQHPYDEVVDSDSARNKSAITEHPQEEER